MTSPTTPLLRRRIHLAAALGLWMALGGCGFAPRQAPDMPFKTLAFNGFSVAAPMANELKVLVNNSRSTRVTDSLAQAEAILDVQADSQERTKGSITTAGQIRSILLLYRFKFRLRTADGRELLPATELVASRSMSYNESQALGKEAEEANLFRSMQADVADQVMRRLAAVQVR